MPARGYRLGEGRARAQVAEDQGTGAGRPLVQPGPQGILGLEIEGHHPFLAVLADEAQGRGVAAPMDAVQGEVAGLGHPQAAAGHHLDEGLVAQVLGHRTQAVEFLGSGCFGQPQVWEGGTHSRTVPAHILSPTGPLVDKITIL